MGKIIGSRRGKPLLPLPLQRVVFALSAVWTLVAFHSLIRAQADSYPHEHAGVALLSMGVTLMAGSGLVRDNRRIHVALFAAGGACLLAATLLRLVTHA
jgi:hypothetical protein